VSTLLSLIVVPAFYVVSERIKEKLWKSKPPEPVPVKEPALSKDPG
jgi:hypothetical protein